MELEQVVKIGFILLIILLIIFAGSAIAIGFYRYVNGEPDIPDKFKVGVILGLILLSIGALGIYFIK